VSFPWPHALSALKPNGWHFLALAGAGAVLLFATPIVAAIGLTKFVAEDRQWIGLAFIVCICLATALGLQWVVSEATKGRRQATEGAAREHEKTRRLEEAKRNQVSILRNLSPEERLVIRELLNGPDGILSAPHDDGVALTLLAKKVLFRPEQLVYVGSDFKYGLSDWVKNSVREDPTLV